MPDYYSQLINIIILIFDTVGVLIVIWGGIRATYALIHREVKREGLAKRHERVEILRYDFGYAMVLALEFFLAGDIIKLVKSPTWDELGKVAALVAIRTALNYFITKEIKVKKN